MSVGTRLRLSLIDGPELRCAHCGEWWPINAECWAPNRWDRCRECERERSRLYQALRRRDPEFRVAEMGKSRRYRKWLREAHPEYVAAYDRERAARRRQWLREYRRAA